MLVSDRLHIMVSDDMNAALLMEQAGFPRIGRESRHEFTSMPEEFYYLSYGSNILRDRFACYVAGGLPVGSQRVYNGCRDKVLLNDSLGVVFEGSTYFAGFSRVWGGGMAFADFDAPGLSLGRVHLVTREQFEDVVAQECGGEAGMREIDFDKLLKVGSLVDKGMYGHMVYVGTYNYIPVLSFTTSFSEYDVSSGHADFVLNPPAQAYDDTIRKGLVEAFGLDDELLNVYMDNVLGYL